MRQAHGSGLPNSEPRARAGSRFGYLELEVADGGRSGQLVQPLESVRATPRTGSVRPMDRETELHVHQFFHVVHVLERLLVQVVAAVHLDKDHRLAATAAHDAYEHP